MNLIKVVRQTEDGLASCIMGQPGLEQIYTPGQLHEARIGGFFAFDNLDDALVFKQRYDYIVDRGHLQLWNAECNETDVLPTPMFTHGAAVRIEQIERFWDTWLSSKKLITTSVTTWSGTVIVKRLRLTSEIGQPDEATQGGSFE